MDRPIDPTVTKRRLFKRVALSLVTIGLLAALLVLGPGFISPSISRNRIRTAPVTVGPIEATITASGTVLPELEQVLSAAIDARVVRILRRPGALLRKGEPILELDVRDAVSQAETLDQKIALKQNEQKQLKLDLENSLIKLKSQLQIKELEVESLRLRAEQNQKLRWENLISDEELRGSQVERDKAVIELQQLQESIDNAERSNAAQSEGREMEMKILRQERCDAQRRLERATTQSDRDGVLTWVTPEEGAVVREGDLIARIADLNSFRVEATLSDVHASDLSAGLVARVRINDAYLDGGITNVLPTIKDGVMTIIVGLNDKSSPLLRSNLRVDVYLVTARKGRALKVKRGPSIPGSGRQDVFVIRGDMAVKTPVVIGISSFDEAEVQSGLLEGDEVIVSDMTDHLHRKEVRVR